MARIRLRPLRSRIVEVVQEVVKEALLAGFGLVAGNTVQVWSAGERMHGEATNLASWMKGTNHGHELRIELEALDYQTEQIPAGRNPGLLKSRSVMSNRGISEVLKQVLTVTAHVSPRCSPLRRRATASSVCCVVSAVWAT